MEKAREEESQTSAQTWSETRVARMQSWKRFLPSPPNPGAAEVMPLVLSDPDSEALLKLCVLLRHVLLALTPTYVFTQGSLGA